MSLFKHLRKKDKNNDLDKQEPTTIQDKLICHSPELISFITKWCENEEWKLKDFICFMETIGLKTPMKADRFNQPNRFRMRDTEGNVVEIELYAAKYNIISSEIGVYWQPNEKIVYRVNSNYPKGKQPEAVIEGRQICENGRELEYYYAPHYITIKMKISEACNLDAEMHKVANLKYERKVVIPKHGDRLTQYLLELPEDNINIKEVLNKVADYVGLTDADWKYSPKIQVSIYEEEKGNLKSRKNKLHQKVSIKNGEVEEVILEVLPEKDSENDGEGHIMDPRGTFFLYGNGNWKYKTGNNWILYEPESKRYTLSAIGDGVTMYSFSVKQFREIRDKVESLFDEVFNHIRNV